jgi:hypothetical protein
MAVASQTVAPEVKKSRTPLIAALAGAVLLGGIAAFMALKGGGETPAAKASGPVAITPVPTTEPPKPEPSKPAAEEPKVSPPEVKPAPSTIVVEINIGNATVTVDDKQVDVKGKIARATVDNEGPHKIVVSAAGRTTFEHTIDTKAGDTQTLIVKLDKSTAGTTTAGKKTGTTTTTTTTPAGTGTRPAGAGSGSGRAVYKDPNAPIDPF